MTDQSNTPTPPKKKAPDGNSLLERASKTFNIKGFKAAPVPERLISTGAGRASPRARQLARKTTKPEAGADPVIAQPDASQPAVSPFVPAAPVAAEAVQPAVVPVPARVPPAPPVEPVHFTGAV